MAYLILKECEAHKHTAQMVWKPCGAINPTNTLAAGLQT